MIKAEARRERHGAIRIAYGNALMAARGHGARETSEVFARIRKSSVDAASAPERLAANYGVWVGAYMLGDLPAMRMHSAAFLDDVWSRP